MSVFLFILGKIFACCVINFLDCKGEEMSPGKAMIDPIVCEIAPTFCFNKN